MKANLVDSDEIVAVDARSEKCIGTLHPIVQPFARALVHRARKAGITIEVISGTRTIAEQDAIYAKGRATPGKIVTRVKGGYSNHNFGIAFDVGIFEGLEYIEESPQYKVVGKLGTEIGLEWGGNWARFADEPHFQLVPEWARKLAGTDDQAILAALRVRMSDGQDLYA